MATKLHQIIAVRQGKVTRIKQEVTEVYHTLQKSNLFDGLSRTYNGTYEVDGVVESLPSEHKMVQCKVFELLNKAQESWTDLLDTTLTQDVANTKALATVEIDGNALLKDVPVTFLIFLEKYLTEVHAMVSAIPVCDPGENWTYDPSSDLLVSNESVSNRMKKVPKTLIKYEATTEHPAQTEVYHEDIKVGEWHVKKFSGALPKSKKNVMLSRIINLQNAVKVARSKANDTEVEDQKAGKQIFDYIFNPT